MARTHAVQTPGAAPTNPDTSIQTNPGDQAGATSAAVSKPDDSAAPTREQPAKHVPRKSAPTREEYAKMRAHDVDPTAITAPVLTADGYVVPAPKEAK